MLPQTLLVALVAVPLSGASMPGLQRRQVFNGIATFNNYAAQGNTVCGPKSGIPGTYGGAAGELSGDISGGPCAASIETSKCAGQGAVPGYEPPQCSRSNCGFCYRVTNQGGYGGASIGGVGNTVVVQIIDSCPSVNAWNFCKTNVPLDERCGSPGTNAMDIDERAYQALTGQPFGSGPNLHISISPIPCP